MIILFLGGVIVEKLYTIKEFAEIMGIAVVTARLWIKQNKINVVRVSRVIRIKESEIIRLQKGE